MKYTVVAVVVVVVLLQGRTATAQVDPDTLVNAKAGTVGLVMMLVGSGILWPSGEDTYRVVDRSYCVSARTVDAGKCGPSHRAAQVGVPMLGTGIALMFYGFRDKPEPPVTIAPTRTGKGIVLNIRWGHRG